VFRVAWKDLMARKRRLVTTSIAVMIGIAFLTGTQLLSATLSESIEDLIGDVYEGFDAVVRSPEAQETGFGDIRNPVPAALVDEVAAVDGVRTAEGLVEATGPNLLDDRGKVVGGGVGPPTLTYNWIDDEELRLGVLTEGRGPEAPDEVALDFRSAEDAGVEVGGTASIATNEQGTEEFRLVGLLGLGEDGTRSSGARVLSFTTPTAQRLVGQPDQYNFVAVAGRDGIAEDQLARRLGDALPEWQVLTGEAFIEESQEAISAFVDILGRFVTVFGVISLVVATFIIYNTFSIIVAQRTRETALLRAVGARRRQVLVATLLEALIIGLIASVLGLLAGVGLAAGLNRLVGQFFTVGRAVPPITGGIVALALAIGVGITVLSALAPAIRSTAIPPIAALQEVSLDRSDVSVARKVWGVLLLLAGAGAIGAGLADATPNPLAVVGLGALLTLVAVAVVLGPLIAAPVSRLLALPFSAGGRISGRLAGENAARNPRRTAATAAALTIGVTLVSVIAILAASIKATADEQISSSLRADFVVATSTFTLGAGIPEGVADRIAELDDVAVSSPVRFTFFTLLDRPAEPDATTTTAPAGVLGQSDTGPAGDQTTALGIDPATWFEVVDSGELQGSPEDLVEGTMAVSADVAEDRGWSLGDEVPVYFGATGRRDLRVALVFGRSLGQNGIYLPLATFVPNNLPLFNVDNQIYVQATDGADLDRLRDQLEDLVADSPTTQVQDLTEFTEAQTGPIDTFLAIVYGLLGLAIVIALIGIANTLSLSILERTRELGLLRAVGMSRRQLRGVVRLEAAIIAVFGTLLGLVIGIAFSIALTVAISADTPDVFTYRLPVVQLVVITVGAALAGVVAAWLPARRAANLDVLAAIATE
jgi:putative ABC transport system permease protein